MQSSPPSRSRQRNVYAGLRALASLPPRLPCVPVRTRVALAAMDDVLKVRMSECTCRIAAAGKVRDTNTNASIGGHVGLDKPAASRSVDFATLCGTFVRPGYR